MKSLILTNLCLGVVIVRDTVCFFGKFYKWLVMLSEYTTVP